MRKNTIIRRAAWLLLASLVLGALIMGCQSAVGGSSAKTATDVKSISVNVTWTAPTTAKTSSTSRALPVSGVSSVTVLPYSQAGVSILNDTTYALASYSLTNTGSVWKGTINVSATGPAVFALTAYSSGSIVSYVGKATYTVTGSHDSVTISTGLASLISGAIQGQVPTLSTYVNTFAGDPSTYGLNTFASGGAAFTSPFGITTDGTNLFVTDYSGFTINKIPIATGVVTVLAGLKGTSGTNSISTVAGNDARFVSPSGITTDGTYLYVCTDNTIDRVTIADGTSVLYAGSSSDTAKTTDGSGINSSYFNQPRGITYLGGYLYVADTSNSNIRRVALGDSASGSSYTYEGQPAKWVQAADGAVGIYAAISTPSAITTDGTYLYVANSGANNIIKIAVDGSSDSVVIAGLNDPKGITTDGTYLYVSDSSNYKVKKVLISTPALVTVAGTGAIAPANTDAVGTLATFDLPYGITTDGKNIYVVDSANFNIRKIQ